MNNIVLCTGFHRSGTSLMAQILHRSGIHMGDNLMAAHISNPDGHFEDMAAVIMHDKLLKASNTDWKYAGEQPLICEPISTRKIKRYIAHRSINHTSSAPWGIKDPRAALFLNSWQAASDNALKTVLLYRHWTSCIASLYKRHSAVLAHELPTHGQAADHIAFWQQPELALKMWITTNEAIANYFEHHYEHSALIAQESITNEKMVCEVLSTQLNIPVYFAEPSVIKPALSANTLNNLTMHMLPQHLVDTADALYDRLNAAATVSNTNSRHTNRTETPSQQRIIYCSTDSHDASTISSYAKTKVQGVATPLMQAPLAEIIDALKIHLPLDSQTSTQLMPLSYTMIRRFPNSWQAHEWAGRIYSAANDHNSALHHFDKAINLNESVPYLYLLKGHAHKALKHYSEACGAYQIAAEKNPNNKSFFFALSTTFLLLGDTESAHQNILLAIELGSGKEMHFRLQHLKCLRELDYDQYLETAQRYWTAHHELPIGRMLTGDLIKRNYKHGRLLYNETVKHSLSKQDLNVWLQTIHQDIESDCAKAHLEALILKHWKALYGDTLDAFLREHSLEVRHKDE